MDFDIIRAEDFNWHSLYTCKLTTFNHLLNAPIQVKENVFYILKHTLLYIKESKLSHCWGIKW